MKKGFTLIEIIAVIVILGIIGIIVVPISNGVIKRSNEKMYNEQVTRIIDACKSYVLENDNNDPDENYQNTISISTLKNEGYLDNSKELINPKTKKEMKGYVKVTYSSYEGYSYEYVEN